VINKIGRPRCGGPIGLITSMITGQIGRHKLLLPINHTHYNFPENKSIPVSMVWFPYYAFLARVGLLEEVV